MKGRPVSIKDIARAVGVSHPTVSRALHGSPLVRAETAAAIKTKAVELGYKASAVARSLVTRRTETIGLVVTAVSDPFYGEVVTGVEEVTSERGYSVILANSPIDPDREIDVVRSLQERRVDGILVASSRVGERYLSLMSEMEVPVVLINNQGEGEFVYSVSIDDFCGTSRATGYLTQLGHVDIAYLGDSVGFESEIDRQAGYKHALNEAGIPHRSEYIVQGNGLPEFAAEAANQLLSLEHPPTAIVCYNDMSALGALSAAAERGLKVPEDLSIVGFDDLFFASFVQPPLTTIHQPMRQMGRRATEMLFTLLQGGVVQKKVKVQGELIARRSTCAPGPKP